MPVTGPSCTADCAMNVRLGTSHLMASSFITHPFLVTNGSVQIVYVCVFVCMGEKCFDEPHYVTEYANLDPLTGALSSL